MINEILRHGSPILTEVESIPRVRVLGGRISPLDLDRTASLLLEIVKVRTRSYVCIANVHTTTLALQDRNFKKALNGGAAVVADGMPVLWRVRAAGHPQAGRVYGADLLEATCAAGIGQKLRHGFFGGVEGVADKMASCLIEHYPSIQIAGAWNPGMIRLGEASPPQLIEAINNSECDVLWVGLGAPKQEIWMAQHRPLLHAPVLVGVGQAFDIIGGRTTRPPTWISSHGLEWLYRLAHEPRRLWKRYVIYNSLFLWYLILECAGASTDCNPLDRGL